MTGRARRGCLFVSLLAAIALAAPVIGAGPHGPLDAQAHERLNELLGLRRSELVPLFVDERDGAAMHVSVPFQGGLYALDLERRRVRAEGYRLLVQQADGSLVEADSGPDGSVRGTVAGLRGSQVAGTVAEGRLSAMIELGGGERLWVEPVAERIPGLPADLHVVYHDDDAPECQGICGVKQEWIDAAAAPAPGAPGGIAGAGGPCVAELACDADFEYFLSYGSVAAVEARINLVINTVNVQYENEVGITHLITAIIVRAAEPDPYTSTNFDTLLNQFIAEWTTNQAAVPRDVAQLFTNKNLAGGVIGVAATIGGVCSFTLGYCLVWSDFNNTFSCATDLSAHELGHLWGATHCSCPGHTMNAFITCANTFHPTLTVPQILAFRDSVTCLDNCRGGGGSNCCIPHGTPGCDDPECQGKICALDPFCCNVEWDSLCADAALTQCAACLPPTGCCEGDEIPEGEACGADTHSGCNSIPPVFHAAACGQAFCGTAWAEGGTRDTDWYLVESGDGILSGTLRSEFPGVCFILDGIASCAPVVLGDIGCSADCAVKQVASAPVAAGTYAVFVATGTCDGGGVFDGVPCGSGNEYTLAIACPPPGPPEEACCFGDLTCADLAAEHCVALGGAPQGKGTSCAATACPNPCPGKGNCVLPHGGIGCEDAACCTTVCAIDTFCCEVSWDQFCADLAKALCDLPCSLSSGSCFLPDGTPGCNDSECCKTVCRVDPFCCDIGWDEICVDEANDLCIGCLGDTDDDDVVGVQDLVNVVLNWGPCEFPPCLGDINKDGEVDVQDMVLVVVNWGLCDDLPGCCAGGETAEGEACGEDTNGGCNSVPAAFTPAACGSVFCGTAWAEGGTRDTDWYLVSVPAGTLISAALTSSFPGLCFIVDGIAACTPVIIGLTGCGADCKNLAAASACVAAAGDYVVFVAPGDCAGNGLFDGLPCGSGSNGYVVSISCAPCTPGLCVPGAGPCCAAHATPGCDQPACCDAICAVDPFCCEVEWDQLCVNAALGTPGCFCPAAAVAPRATTRVAPTATGTAAPPIRGWR